MKHTHLNHSSNSNAVPACEACGSTTRLVGLEQAPGGLSGDVATYQCLVCANVQAHWYARSATER